MTDSITVEGASWDKKITTSLYFLVMALKSSTLNEITEIMLNGLRNEAVH